MPDNRPRDRDLAKQLLRQLRREAELPVVFLAMGGPSGSVISEGVGLRQDGVRGLTIRVGEGLGGRVLRDKRPGVVSDYGMSKTITDTYREYVRREGLGAVFAVPILSGSGDTRMILYGAHRSTVQFGDDIRGIAMQLAARGAGELRIRDEVDRRVAMAVHNVVDLEQSGERASSADLERLRELHADLRAIAATVADDEARERLLAASGGLAEILQPGRLGGGGGTARSGGGLIVPGSGAGNGAGSGAALPGGRSDARSSDGAGTGESAGASASAAPGSGSVGAGASGGVAGRGPASAAAPDVPALTSRELDVLSQVALGCTNAEAANRLSLSVETIKAYLRNASSKLGVRGRHAAVSRARSLGLLP